MQHDLFVHVYAVYKIITCGIVDESRKSVRKNRGGKISETVPATTKKLMWYSLNESRIFKTLSESNDLML